MKALYSALCAIWTARAAQSHNMLLGHNWSIKQATGRKPDELRNTHYCWLPDCFSYQTCQWWKPLHDMLLYVVIQDEIAKDFWCTPANHTQVQSKLLRIWISYTCGKDWPPFEPEAKDSDPRTYDHSQRMRNLSCKVTTDSCNEAWLMPLADSFGRIDDSSCLATNALERWILPQPCSPSWKWLMQTKWSKVSKITAPAAIPCFPQRSERRSFNGCGGGKLTAPLRIWNDFMGGFKAKLSQGQCVLHFPCR